MRFIVDMLERAWPAVLCSSLALVAYLQANAVSQLVGATIEPPPPSSSRVAPPPTFARERVDATPILHRNPFDSVTGALDGTEPPPPPPQPALPADPLSVPKCEFGYVTLIVDADDAYAFAAIETKGGESKLRRIGDKIDDHELVDIAPRRVWLDGKSKRCQMQLGDKVVVRKKRPAPRKPRRPRRRRATSTRVPKRITDKIKRVSDTEFHIERSALDEILEMQGQLLRRTRVRPLKKGDQVVGMRVSRVLNGTLFDTIGLKSGDVIKSINGFDLTNAQKALEAYGRLRSANRMSVQMERRGKPMTIEYRIQ